MATAEKCDNCGKMTELSFELWYARGSSFEGQVLKFCYECGQKINKILEEGVN